MGNSIIGSFVMMAALLAPVALLIILFDLNALTAMVLGYMAGVLGFVFTRGLILWLDEKWG